MVIVGLGVCSGLAPGYEGMVFGVRWPCSWLALEMAIGFGLALEVFLGGKGFLILGGGRPPGEGMAALCLVSFIGVRSSCWLAAAIVAAFCFF